MEQKPYIRRGANEKLLRTSLKGNRIQVKSDLWNDNIKSNECTIQSLTDSKAARLTDKLTIKTVLQMLKKLSERVISSNKNSALRKSGSFNLTE